MQDLFQKLDYYNKLRYFNQNIYLNKWFRTRDSIGMLEGIEIRVPYCDTKLFQLANSKSYKNHENKKVLKQIAIKNNFRHVAKKIGFTIPIMSWLDKKTVQKLLLKTNFYKSKDYNFAKIEELFKLHFSKKINIDRTIWSLIAFETWKKYHFSY